MKIKVEFIVLLKDKNTNKIYVVHNFDLCDTEKQAIDIINDMFDYVYESEDIIVDDDYFIRVTVPGAAYNYEYSNDKKVLEYLFPLNKDYDFRKDSINIIDKKIIDFDINRNKKIYIQFADDVPYRLEDKDFTRSPKYHLCDIVECNNKIYIVIEVPIFNKSLWRFGYRLIPYHDDIDVIKCDYKDEICYENDKFSDIIYEDYLSLNTNKIKYKYLCIYSYLSGDIFTMRSNDIKDIYDHILLLRSKGKCNDGFYSNILYYENGIDYNIIITFSEENDKFIVKIESIKNGISNIQISHDIILGGM